MLMTAGKIDELNKLKLLLKKKQEKNGKKYSLLYTGAYHVSLGGDYITTENTMINLTQNLLTTTEGRSTLIQRKSKHIDSIVKEINLFMHPEYLKSNSMKNNRKHTYI